MALLYPDWLGFLWHSIKTSGSNGTLLLVTIALVQKNKNPPLKGIGSWVKHTQKSALVHVFD